MKKLIISILLLANLALSGQCFAEFVNSEAQEKAAAEAKRIAEHNAKIQKLQSVVGLRFYAHFPRESCQKAVDSQPSIHNKNKFTSNTPVHVLIEEIVIDQSSYDPSNSYYFFYRIRLDDGTIGYVKTDFFSMDYFDSSEGYSLKYGCWSKLNPVELQAQIEKIESDRNAMNEEAARLELLEKQRLADEEARIKLALQQEQEKNAPETLRNMDRSEFCAAYGEAIREENVYNVGSFQNVVKLVKAEARRRKIAFNDSLISDKKILRGFSECQLYASAGYPNGQNRSGGAWGVHIQYVYSWGYVYTENGRVTSWQF